MSEKNAAAAEPVVRPASSMNVTSGHDRLIIAGLLALAAAPVVGGIVRLLDMGGGMVTPENARFMAAPVPGVLHLVPATFYAVMGAFQFAPGIRRRHPVWHRISGRFLLASGLAASLSGLWMTAFYPRTGFDGPFVDAFRLFAGLGMTWALWRGYRTVLQRDIASHQAWMIRAYAIGMGAGTQAFTSLPLFIFPSIQGEVARSIAMGAGWGINIAVAEWLITRQKRRAAGVRRFPGRTTG